MRYTFSVTGNDRFLTLLSMNNLDRLNKIFPRFYKQTILRSQNSSILTSCYDIHSFFRVNFNKIEFREKVTMCGLMEVLMKETS